MGRPLRNSRGQFQGSLADPRSGNPPLPAAFVPSLDEDDELFGEVADIPALYAGWSQRMQSNESTHSASSAASSVEVRDQYPAVNIDLDRAYAAVDAINSPAGAGNVPSTPELLAQWESLEEVLDPAGEAADALETHLAHRLKSENIEAIDDENSGLHAHAVIGNRYVGWRHEEVQQAITAAIAEKERAFHTPGAQVSAIVGEYLSYASPSYYKVAELKALGLDPEDYSTVGEDASRLVLRGLDEPPTSNVVARAVNTYAIADEVREVAAKVPSIASAIREMDTKSAVVCYSRLRECLSGLREGSFSLKEAARRQLMLMGEEETSSPSGARYRLVAGRATRVVDNAAMRPYVLHTMARDLGIPAQTVERVVQRLEQVARFNSYRLSSLERKLETDVSAHISQRRSPTRLIQVVEDEE